MFVKRGGIRPRLADEEHIRSRGALEHIVGNASFVMLRIAGKFFGGLQRSLVLLDVVGLEKAIQSYHIRISSWLTYNYLTFKLKNYFVNRRIYCFQMQKYMEKLS